MSMPQAAVALLGLALLASPATAENADLALPPVPEVTVSVEVLPMYSLGLRGAA